MGSTATSGEDRLRWFMIAQKVLDGEKMGGLFGPLEFQLLKLMVIERIETKEFQLVDQMIGILLEVKYN
jgi:hypothetical protein